MCTSFLWNNVSIGKASAPWAGFSYYRYPSGVNPPIPQLPCQCLHQPHSYLISITILSIHRHHWSHSELDRILIPIWFSHAHWNLEQLDDTPSLGGQWVQFWGRQYMVSQLVQGWHCEMIYNLYYPYTVIYTRCSGDTTPLTVCIHCCAAAAVGKLFEFIRHFVAVRFRNCPFWRSYTPDTGWHESSQGLHWSQAVCDGASRKNRFCFKIWDFRPIFTLFPVGCRRWTC